MCIPVICVYPRTHIPSDMCIPPIWLPMKCVSPTPTPPNKCRFYFCCFCEFCESSSKGLQMTQDYEQHNRQKSNDSRQNNGKAVSASLLLRGPQCWCKHSFSLLSLSSVIIIHVSLVALNKYDWQNFIQQGITRKVKKWRGDTHISALVQWYVYPPVQAL